MAEREIDAKVLQEKSFTLDDKPVDMVAYKKTREGGLGNVKYDVTFAKDLQPVATLKGLKADDLEIAVGEKNAAAIVSGKPEGQIAGKNLQPAAGLSPEEHDRRIHAKEDTVIAAAAARGAAALASAKAMQLSADFSDDLRSRDVEREDAAKLEERAYKTLAVVPAEVAERAVRAEREKFKDDMQLSGSIAIDRNRLEDVRAELRREAQEVLAPSNKPLAEEKAEKNKLINATQHQRANGIENDDVLAQRSRKPERPVTASLAEKYTQDGDNFYERGGDLNKAAFVDRGDQLRTARDDDKTARDMVELAKARGWKEIELKGTNEFKRAAWEEAEANGIKTKGYEPSDKDIEAAAHRRSIIEARETSNITAPSGKLPNELTDKTQNNPEAVKDAGIRNLARAVAKELLVGPKLQNRFEDIVEQHLKERAQSGQKLPQVYLKDVRDKEPRQMEAETELSR